MKLADLPEMRSFYAPRGRNKMKKNKRSLYKNNKSHEYGTKKD
jgi:hypothetical protein